MNEVDERFHDFVVARGRRMVSFACLLTRDLAAAEDLVQESLLRSYRQWTKAGAPEHPDAYVRRAIVNQYVSAGRRRQVPLRGLTVSEGTPAAATHDVGDRDLLWRLLAELPRKQQAVLVLRYYEDLDDESIASVLGCARATVRSLAARGLAVLRERPEVAQAYGGEEAGSTA